MGSGGFDIGAGKWTERMGSAVVEYDGDVVYDHKKADGKDKSRDTYKGTDAVKITVALEWIDDGTGPIRAAVEGFLGDLSPFAGHGGTPFAWVEDSQHYFGVNDVTVAKMKVVYPKGMGIGTATLQLREWTKPGNQPSITATPAISDPWDPSDGAPSPKPAPGFLDGGGPKVTVTQ